MPDLRDAREVAVEGRFGRDQVLYHPQVRAIEHFLLPWYERHNVAVVGNSPFGHGDFPDIHSKDGRVLERSADAHHATTRQVALRLQVGWPLLLTIPKASIPDQAEENAVAGNFHLSRVEIIEIDEAFPSVLRPSNVK